MTLDKYTPFQPKKNATYHGDPNGSYIMAEDVNLIQESVTQLEKVIGLHSNQLTLTERIDRVAQNAALRADKFIVYRGNPLLAYKTLEESIHSFSFVEHLVLEKQRDGGFDSFLSGIRMAQTKLYGYIDCTSTQSLSAIQLDMEWWRSRGAVGVFLANFDYSYGNTRTRQNDIILAAHERGLRAIVTGALNYLLFNAEHVQNPDWTPLVITSTDGYYLSNAFIQNGVKKGYDTSLSLAKDLIRAKESLHISIYIEDTANGSASATQGLYEHGHSLALLFGMDGYFVNRTDFYQLNDPIRYYEWAPFVGAWSDEHITLIETISDVRRRTNFGEIIYAKSSNVVIFTGLTIPPELMKWKDNSIPGTAIMSGSIPDSKIESYDGSRLIDSVNTSPSQKRISLSKLESPLLQDMEGVVSLSGLKVNVIEAINANIGNAKIDSAVISNLTAGHISASVIEAVNIAAGHVEAGSAYIHGAIIDHLDAGSIRTGSLDAQLLRANVITAINANIGKAVIDSAVIGELRADRMQAEVISAINLYAQSAVINKARIDSAAIGFLKAENIEAEVIKAINANIGLAYIDKAVIPILDSSHIKTAVIEALEANIGIAIIDSALIGELNVQHMKGKVVEAINLSAVDAVIEGAKIKEATIGTAHIIKGSITNAEIADATIKTANIALGAVTSAIIGEGQVGTINIAQGSITDALIKNLSADKINAGTINSSLVKIQGENGFLRLWGNRLQVFDDQSVPVERVSLGDVNNDGTVFGFRVRGADGQTVLYDEKGVYNEGITDGAITNPKIGDDAVDGRVIKAESVIAEHILAGEIKADHIATDAITTRHILSGSITAGSAIIADGAIGRAEIANAAIGAAQIEDAVITDAHIDNLNANKINAGKVKAEFVEIGGDTHFLEGYDPKRIDASLRNDLRLTSALPTTITLNSAGIKATTFDDPSKFVSLDYRGLYVHNGAIIIEGGLTKDNMDSGVTDEWDKAVQFTNEMSSDDVLTTSEKRLLQRDWNEFILEYNSLINQANDYWPDDSKAPASKSNYSSQHNQLNQYLNVTPDLNNGLPILSAINIINSSQIDGALLNKKLSDYKSAKVALEKEITQHAKDLADAAQREVDELSKQLPYRVDVISTKGTVFVNGQIDTILQAVVYYGSNNVTDSIDAEHLLWKRTSNNPSADIAWNQAHSQGAKSIVITKDDIYMRAIFNCDLIDDQ